MPPVRALQRGLDVLFAVVDAGEPLQLGEIARRTRLHKASASRLLGTLAEAGFVSHNTVQGTYAIGAEVARRFASGGVEPTWHALARSLLADLRDQSGETVGLFVPLWPDRMCIEQAESRSGLRRVFVIGERSPLTVGSTGRSYLAYVSDAEVDVALRLRPLAGVSADSEHDRTWFFDEIASVRRNGYGLSDAEGIVGMCAMGAPVFGDGERPIAMIAISGPTGRWTTEARHTFAPTLVQATQKLGAVAASGVRQRVPA